MLLAGKNEILMLSERKKISNTIKSKTRAERTNKMIGKPRKQL